MFLIRGTGKFLKEAGKSANRIDEPGNEGVLGSWFANLLWFERRKCVLFTHGDTLYSFFAPDVRRSDLVQLDAFVHFHLGMSLVINGFSSDFVQGVLQKVKDPVLARTNNRSVLGSMNDLAYQCEAEIVMSGGLEWCDMVRLNHRLNRNPLSAIGYAHAVDRFRERFGEST